MACCKAATASSSVARSAAACWPTEMTLLTARPPARRRSPGRPGRCPARLPTRRGRRRSPAVPAAAGTPGQLARMSISAGVGLGADQLPVSGRGRRGWRRAPAPLARSIRPENQFCGCLRLPADRTCGAVQVTRRRWLLVMRRAPHLIHLLTVICIILGSMLVPLAMHGGGLAVAVEPGRDRGGGGLAGLAVAACGSRWFPWPSPRRPGAAAGSASPAGRRPSSGHAAGMYSRHHASCRVSR